MFNFQLFKMSVLYVILVLVITSLQNKVHWENRNKQNGENVYFIKHLISRNLSMAENVNTDEKGEQ